MHCEAPSDESRRGLARPRADLERGIVRLEASVLDHRVEQAVRIRGPRRVVLVGDLTEHEGLLAPRLAGRHADLGQDAMRLAGIERVVEEFLENHLRPAVWLVARLEGEFFLSEVFEQPARLKVPSL